MIFKFILNILSWLNRRRPIVKIAMLNKSMQYDVLKKSLKTKRIPDDGEIIYFKEEGPYYTVSKIMHHIGKRHIIWVIVSLMEINQLSDVDKKIL